MTTGPGSRLLAALAGLRSELNAAGIPAATEPGEVPVPGAWIDAQTVEVTELDGGGTAVVNLYLVASDSGENAVMPVLCGLLDAVHPLVTYNEYEQTNVGASLALPAVGVLPAFRLVINLDI